MLLALRSLWEKQGPSKHSPFVSRASGVAVAYALGMGWAIDTAAGRIVIQNPTMLEREARAMGYSRVDFDIS